MATKIPAPSNTRITVRTPAYHSVSRSRSRSSDGVMNSRAKPVACAADRRDHLRLEAIVDLRPQAADQHIEQVRERIVIVVPDVRGDGGAIDDLPLMAREQLEQREFLRRQSDQTTSARGTPRWSSDHSDGEGIRAARAV